MELIGTNLGMLMALRMTGRELGDCPNIEMKTMGGRKFWITNQEKQGWKLQTNKITKLSRILDDNNRRKAWGNPAAMAEKFKRLVRQEFLEPGDVIGVARKKALRVYDHYAVYIGDGRVIHYAGTGNDFSGEITIHEADMKEFLKDDEKFFVLFFQGAKNPPIKIQSATNFNFDDSTVAKSLLLEDRRNYHFYSARETIQRARSRIGEDRYHLLFNNCEHFAIWSKTNISESYQVKNKMKYLSVFLRMPVWHYV